MADTYNLANRARSNKYLPHITDMDHQQRLALHGIAPAPTGYGAMSGVPERPAWLKSTADYMNANPGRQLFTGGVANVLDKMYWDEKPSYFDNAMAGLDLPMGAGVKAAIPVVAGAAGLVGLMGRQVAPDALKWGRQAGAVGTPNPDAVRIANDLIRDQNWSKLHDAGPNAGVKRSPSTGRYVGAGPGVTSPQKKTALVNKYIDRTQASIDAGIPPGYFYEQGRNAIADVTPTVESHRRFADVIGPTSTQVGPKENLNYAIRAMDQTAMGNQVSVGMYPNNLRGPVEGAISGDAPWKGYKVERYSNLLGPADSQMDQLHMMPPNDQWEGFATGLARGQVPSGAPQVAFSDHVREQAMTRMNAKRVGEGLPPLTRAEMQELHWAAIRAQTDGRPLQLNPGDTIQGSMPGQVFQHSWEAAPGPSSGHNLNGMDIQAYTDEMFDVLVDSQGKDKLISAMGGELQLPMVRGQGVYKGDVAPGVQSRSLASHTLTHGLDPSSAKRVDSTEAVRQFALAQDGRAGHIVQPAKKKKDVNVFDYKTGGPPTADQTIALEKIVNKGLGVDAGGNPNAAIVFTGDGYRVLNFGDLDNAAFSKNLASIKDELDSVTGQSTAAGGKSLSIYDEYDWSGGNATRGLLDVLDDPMHPGAAKLADSPETRQLMGEFGDVYEKLRGAGMEPNERLVNVLNTWKTKGLAGVRSLVDRGLAPALVLPVLGASSLQHSQGQRTQSYD
ncbi:MAG: hypothetical protein GY753_07675 [Gammaproteobacteria bacterium]|nr:hypothetical protein [Gammaproteobacteria bacterium]